MKWKICFIHFVFLFCGYTSFRIKHANEELAKPFDPNIFNGYQSIVNHLHEIHETNPKNTELEQIGVSFENRTLYLMKIFKKSKLEKPVIFIDANIHAREWVSNAIALNLINELLLNPQMLNKIDWYIIPMVNPDGYEFSRTSSKNRYWRKNRSTSDDSPCVGVDLNRNFPYHWGEAGVSPDRCDYQIYNGPKPLSEPESIALSNTLIKYVKRIPLYLTLHSYGGTIVYPYGYGVNKLPRNWRNLRMFGKIMADSIERVSGSKYNVTNSASWYPAAGGSDDYAKGMLNIPFVFTIEFTKEDFTFPEEKLGGLYRESMAAFRAASNVIAKLFKPKFKKHV